MPISVANLIRPVELVPNTMLSAIVGGADAAIPVVSAGGEEGINGTTDAQRLRNASNPLVQGNHYSAWTGNFSNSYSLSAVDEAFFVHFRWQNPTYNRIDDNADSMRLILFSGNSATEYARWNIDGNRQILFAGEWFIFSAAGTPDFSTAGWDNTDVTGAGFSVEARQSGASFAIDFVLDQMLFLQGKLTLEGSQTGSATMSDYFDLLKSNSAESYRSLLVSETGGVYTFKTPISIRSDDYSDSAPFQFFQGNSDGFPAPASGYYNSEIVAPANGSINISNSYLIGSIDYSLTIDSSAVNSSLTVAGALFSGITDVTVSGSGVDFRSSIFAQPTNMTITNGPSFNNVSVSSPINPLVIDGPLAPSSDLNIIDPQSDAIQFDSIGDYSGNIFQLPGGSVVNVNDSGSIDLTGISSSGSVEFDNLAASAVTVTLDPSLTAITSNPTSGGGSITLDNSVLTSVTLTQLKNPSEVRIFDAGTQTELAGQETITSGSFISQLPLGTTAVDISILSLGYKNQRLLNIPTNQDVNIPVSQELDRQYENP